MRVSHWISDEQAKEAFQVIEGFISTVDSKKYSQEHCSQALWVWHAWKKQKAQSRAPLQNPTSPIFPD